MVLTKNGAGGACAKMSDDDPAGFYRKNAENRKICSRQVKSRKKRVLKVKRANPDLDIFGKKPKNPFSP